MTRARHCLVLAGAILALLFPNLIFSCGPFATITLFSLPNRPDSDADFARGKLGIVRSTFEREYLFVAYRVLNGAPLSADEQKLCAPCGNDSTDPDLAAKAWADARAQVAGGPVAGAVSPYAPTSGWASYLNCPADAFRNAARTLDERFARFGRTSSEVKQWLAGQDDVFANCEGKRQVVPARLDAASNPLLRADREYQIAAAHFYSGKYEDAHAEFQRIAQDRQSPWSIFAPYLAARSLVRRATMDLPDNSAEYSAALARAEGELKAVLADGSRSAMHAAAQRMLGFVEFRLHPAERARELAQALARGRSNPDLRLQLGDYLRLLRNGDAPAEDDLTAWLQTMKQEQSEAAKPNPGRFGEAMAHWRRQKTTPWLLAALLFAPSGTPESEELLAAARSVPSNSPAYLTARYHMGRLLLSAGRTEAARTLLDETLGSPTLKGLPSSRNLFLEEREQAARNFGEFLKYAQREPVASGYDDTGDGNLEPGGELPVKGPMFDFGPAATLNQRMPLRLLQEAASGDMLAPRLRRQLATAAWVRAALLNDSAAADSLAARVAALEPALKTDMDRYRAAASAEAKRFSAVFTILRNPGMRPHLDAGEGRSSYKGEEPLNTLDDLRDNWWCHDVGADIGSPAFAKVWRDTTPGGEPPVYTGPPFPAFLTAVQRAAATREWQRLSQIGAAPNYLAAEAVRWARAHPEDARNPEALHLAVRSTRYGCTDEQTTAFSKAAFRLLHSRYGRSEWAKKTPYYF